MSDGPADPVAGAGSEAPGAARDVAGSSVPETAVDETGSGDEPTFDDRLAAAREALDREKPGIGPERLEEYTTDRRSLDSRVQFQWGPGTAAGVVVFTLSVLAGLTATSSPLWFALPVLVVVSVLGGALLRLRYRLWVYQIREDAIYLERGVFVHRRSLVPYVRIQHVDTSRGPLERALGLSTLVVYTAGSRGADVSIPGLTPEEARDLQGRVKEFSVEAEGDDAV